MIIKYKCECGTEYTYNDTVIGHSIKCFYCGRTFVISAALLNKNKPPTKKSNTIHPTSPAPDIPKNQDNTASNPIQNKVPTKKTRKDATFYDDFAEEVIIGASPGKKTENGSSSVSKISQGNTPPPINRKSGTSVIPPPINRNAGANVTPPPINRKSGTSVTPPPINRNAGTSVTPPPINRNAGTSVTPPQINRNAGMTPPPVISGNTTTKKDDSIAQGFQLYRAAVSEQAQDDEIHENEVYQEGKPSLEIISDPEEKYEEYSYNNEELGNFDQKIPSEEPLLDEELISVTDPQQKSDDLHDASSLIHNHYALKQTIKVGGMGRIILARDNIMERLVAIKEIRPELLKEYKNAEMYRKRLILEAKITGYLDHPGIVPVYSLDTDKNGNPFYVMRCIRGITFEEAIKNFHVQGTIQMMRDLLRRFIEICQIIAYAHDLGVIHRDIKPVNLMLGNFGATFVMDWGLAKKIQVNSNDLEMEEESNKIFSFGGDDMRLTQLGAVVGTRWYRSPEYLRTQQNTVQNDIYALGVTLYKFLTNKLPYYHDTMRENTVFTLQTPKPPHELNKLVDKVLAAICMKAISQDCDIRYSSAMNFADDIQRWLENQPVTAYEYSFWERFCHKFQRN